MTSDGPLTDVDPAYPSMDGTTSLNPLCWFQGTKKLAQPYHESGKPWRRISVGAEGEEPGRSRYDHVWPVESSVCLSVYAEGGEVVGCEESDMAQELIWRRLRLCRAGV